MVVGGSQQETLSLDLVLFSTHQYLTDVFIIPNDISEYQIIHSNDPDSTSYLLGLNEARSHFVAYSLLNGQVIWRLKPDFSIYPEYNNNLILNTNDESTNLQRSSTTHLINHHNTIEKFLISGNQSIIIVSYSSECVCVFLMNKLQHVGYLNEFYAMNNNPLSKSLLKEEQLKRLNGPNLSLSMISYDGYWLIHSEYSDDEQCTCLTVWSLIHFHQYQTIPYEYNITWNRKRLLNQSNLIQLNISDYNCIIIGARLHYGILCWCPCKQMTPIYLQGSKQLNYSLDNPPILYISMNGNKIITASGYIKHNQITIWQMDLNHLTICLIGHICYLDNILELKLTKQQYLLCISVMNSNKPLLINPYWIEET
ncbi:unnamed protein product [Schistosoma margrebowiei]|uniref:Uncharacterized protein n=1 Tax=Schistosoma margrebowiei TaxID=48269 RepID=A0A183MJB1_9TREM|nr:unnamed protein product [Schistosoma margrebowiei]